MKKQKYVIVSYRSQAGGDIALRNLCRLLNECGQDAKTIYLHSYNYDEKHVFSFWLSWLLRNCKVFLKTLFPFLLSKEQKKSFQELTLGNVRKKYTPFIGKNTIVVYNELLKGNPLRAKKIVRWLLFYNRFYKQSEGKTIGYEKNDLFFTYREIFNDYTLNPECKVLCTPYFDLDLYKRYNFGERHGKCYVLRKGKWRVNDSDFKDKIVVDDLSEHEKVRVFNECEYCISYDTQTAYSKIAALCGCISVIVPEEGKQRNDYRTANEDSSGIAFGFSPEEINFAETTRDKIKTKFEEINKQSKEDVERFIRECRIYFGDVKKSVL